MCKHILNAQVQIRAPCCKQWFDCIQCHNNQEIPHELLERSELTFMCKKCKRAFRKDVTDFDETDEYCPHCDNHFVIEAKEPQAALKVESEDVRVDSRFVKDERIRQEPLRTIFNVKDAPDRLG